MEELRVIKKNRFNSIKKIFDDKYDKRFKPGLYNLVKSFLSHNVTDLCTIDEQLENFKFFSKIGNYQ